MTRIHQLFLFIKDIKFVRQLATMLTNQEHMVASFPKVTDLI